MFSNTRSYFRYVRQKSWRYFQRSLDQKVNAHWNDYPFGREPWVDREVYLNLASSAQTKKYPEVDQLENQMGFRIDPEWFHNLALHTQVGFKKTELCYQHGRILYSALSRYLQENPGKDEGEIINIWETGTARGFSCICMAKALNDQKRSGTIITFDLLPHQRPMFWNCIDDHEGPKTRLELLSPWMDLLERHIIFHQGDTRLDLPKVKTNRINFAFLDGAHSYKDVLFEFQQIKDCQQPGDIIVYDDYTKEQFPGIVQAVDEICAEYHYRPTVLKVHNNRGYVVATKF
jgi:hypothetical protein